jgi:hypothetical protein
MEPALWLVLRLPKITSENYPRSLRKTTQAPPAAMSCRQNFSR